MAGGPLPVALHSPNTLVLAFGARRLANDRTPAQALIDTFPDSLLIGCSTAGETAGVGVSDHSVTVAVARFEHTQISLPAPRSVTSTRNLPFAPADLHLVVDRVDQAPVTLYHPTTFHPPSV